MAKTINTGFISDTINGIKVNSSIKCNSGNYTNAPSRSVSYVVMHYTGNARDTAKANASYFTGGNRQASAHFFVDDSEIYQSVEMRDKAWHCGTSGKYYNGCRNANSIGIEMCCTAGNYRISDKTKTNAVYLCAYLCKLIGVTASQVDTFVVRHYDVTRKQCPAQMAGSNNAEWIAFKASVKKVLGGGTVTASTTTTKTNTASSGLSIDGSWGVATTKRAQAVFGTTQDGIISGQPISNKQYLPNAYTGSWQFVSGKASGSQLIKAIQKKIGTSQDGYFGKASVKAFQKWLGVSVDGSMGAVTVKAFQTWLNKQ